VGVVVPVVVVPVVVVLVVVLVAHRVAPASSALLLTQ
jgi:hypothetical protein